MDVGRCQISERGICRSHPGLSLADTEYSHGDISQCTKQQSHVPIRTSIAWEKRLTITVPWLCSGRKYGSAAGFRGRREMNTEDRRSRRVERRSSIQLSLESDLSVKLNRPSYFLGKSWGSGCCWEQVVAGLPPLHARYDPLL